MAQISPDARCESVAIGADTQVGSFAVIPRSCVVGAECDIGVHVTLSDNVVLADRVKVGAGAYVAPGVRLGLNAVIRPGSIVASDVPANAVVEGNPATIVAYSGSPMRELRLVHAASAVQVSPERPVPLQVGSAALWRVPYFGDLRGSLVPIEFGEDLPFTPVRQFLVFGVPGEQVRGEHAHKRCDQFLVAAHGALSVVVDDGSMACEVRLDHPSVGLHVPAGVWAIQYKFTRDAVLAVFASRRYEAEDYLRDYQQFLEHRTSK